MIDTGERQVAPDVSGIRRDHVARYEWAAKVISEIGHGKTVVDFACGIGYGTQIIAQHAKLVGGYDASAEAIEYARQHYAHERVLYAVTDGNDPPPIKADIAVSFETIEHIRDPRPLLRALAAGCTTLLASVPNESVFPWQNHAFHFRHYTAAQFEHLLAETGWTVTEWYGQATDQSDVEKDNMTGRTIIAKAVRSKKQAGKRTTPRKAARAPAPAPKPAPVADAEPRTVPGLAGLRVPFDHMAKAPKRVAILGLGPSVTQYLELTKRMGGRHKHFDEVWAINALGDVFAVDRIFHMDDVRIQEIRAAAAPDSNIATMLAWLKTHPGPIITSRAHPDYPGLVEFPLQAFLREIDGTAYFNSTAAYAIAYAIFIGVEHLAVFGNDFTYENSHHAEKGRACVEFWMGYAKARGMQVTVPHVSSLLDACNTPEARLYGYDTLKVSIQRTAEDGPIVTTTERETLPTAEEIEARYDHTRHVNPLLDKE